MIKSNKVKKDIAALKNEIELQLKMSTNYNTKQIKKMLGNCDFCN